MSRLLLVLVAVIGLYAVAPRLHVDAYPAGAMPPNLAAYELAEEPDYAKAKLATMRLETKASVCSATAIGDTHYKVLTAAHCVEDKVARVFGVQLPDMAKIASLRLGGRTARVLRIEFDAHDGVILTTDLYFKHTATFGPRPVQGDVVFSHGNPATTPDILLVGRVAGWIRAYMGAPDTMLLDRNDWYGCSGAAVFDTEGRIVGVVNSIFPWPNEGWRLTAVYPLTFTAEQLR